MNEKVDFNKIKENEWVEGCCLMNNITKEGVAPTGKPFITVRLIGANNSDTPCTLFDTSSADLKFTLPCVIKSKFTRKRKKDNSLWIDMYQSFEQSDEYSAMDFIKCAPEAPEVYYGRIMKILEACNYESDELTLYDLTKAVLEKHKDKLMYYPAAEKIHHTEKSGLIWHMAKMAKEAHHRSQEYVVKREVVICASILAVINKLYTLDVDENYNARTNKYYFSNNPGELSVTIVNNVASKMELETGKKFNFYNKLNLDICIRSYRGLRRQGASITNITKESRMVADIHDFDVDMYIYDKNNQNIDFYEIGPYDSIIGTQVMNI